MHRKLRRLKSGGQHLFLDPAENAVAGLRTSVRIGKTEVVSEAQFLHLIEFEEEDHLDGCGDPDPLAVGRSALVVKPDLHVGTEQPPPARTTWAAAPIYPEAYPLPSVTTRTSGRGHRARLRPRGGDGDTTVSRVEESASVQTAGADDRGLQLLSLHLCEQLEVVGQIRERRSRSSRRASRPPRGCASLSRGWSGCAASPVIHEHTFVASRSPGRLRALLRRALSTAGPPPGTPS
jgi:hypothetical protein